MAKFRFHLDQVLRLRSNAEKDAQRLLAERMREQLQAENTLRGFHQAIEQEKNDLRQALGQGTGNLASARMQAHASMGLQRKAEASAVALAGAMRRTDAARETLLKAMQQRKAIELLRERAFLEWQADQSRREAAMLDELVVMRHGRLDLHKENPL